MTQPNPAQAIRWNNVPATRPDPGLDGFAHAFRTVNGVRLHFVEGGKPDGQVVVLLAGFPESWYAWRKVMPALGTRYRVIALDLPGQGDSDRPQVGYDTESLAGAVHDFLEQAGVARHALVAHDVGAWVAYPYAALFGKQVRRLVLMDAGIPGITLPDLLPSAPDRAWRTWHFAFHAIPDLPEALIAGREEIYLNWFLRRKTANPESFSDADLAEYLRVFRKEGGLRAGLAYYRAAHLSASQNKVLAARGKLPMPVMALSADHGSIPDMAGPLREFAADVCGAVVPVCGHFIPEEQPEAVARILLDFLGQG